MGIQSEAPRARPDRLALTLGLAAWGLMLVMAAILENAIHWGLGPEASGLPVMEEGTPPAEALWVGLAFAAGLSSFGTWVVAADQTITALRSARGLVCWLAVAVNFGVCGASLLVRWVLTGGGPDA